MNCLTHLEPLPNDALRELLLVVRLEDVFALPLAAGHLVVIRVDVVLAHAARRCMTCATRTHLIRVITTISRHREGRRFAADRCLSALASG
jgi:hypothetical protein